MDKHLLQARDNIIESAGRATQGFGLGRIIGQLYALLFFSPGPMSLDAMAAELRVSKGSVSTNIRELEKWGAVRQIWVKGSRRDFYEAEDDFVRIIKEGILPFLKRKMNSSLVAISESKDLLAKNHQSFSGEDEQLARYYAHRLELIEDAQKKFSLLFKLPGL